MSAFLESPVFSDGNDGVIEYLRAKSLFSSCTPTGDAYLTADTDELEITQVFVFMSKDKTLLSGGLLLYPANRKKSGDCAWNPMIVDRKASITASATFGHSASPDNVTDWYIMALQ